MEGGATGGADCGTPALLELACAFHPKVRPAGTCTRCGTFTCADCQWPTAAGPSVCPSCYQRQDDDPWSWERRAEEGRLKTLWSTTWSILSSPSGTFRSVRPAGSLWSGVLYATVMLFAGYFTTGLLFAVLFGTGLMGGENAAGVKVGRLVAWVYGGAILLLPLAGLAVTLVIGSVDHLILRLIGGKASFEVTLRAACYAMAPMALGVIPVCSTYVVPFWVMVVRVFAYRGVHGLSRGRASIGALVIPVGITLLLGVLISTVLRNASR